VGEAFVISTVGTKIGTESDHLIGTCFYMNSTKGNQARQSVSIVGIQTADGNFWPTVLLQVANEVTGRWHTIEQPSIRGHSVILTVQSNSTSKVLNVDLEAFRPMIGKFRYGRVTLKRGEGAILKLEDLLPPKQDDK
jgi:hypothetical protein